jgi:hypothetical protein
VTKEKERVQRSVALPVLTYLLVLKLYGAEAHDAHEVSLFKLKQLFTTDLFKEHAIRIEERWKRKLNEYRLAA